MALPPFASQELRDALKRMESANPSEYIESFNLLRVKVLESQQKVDTYIINIQELCNNWKPEYRKDYLDNVNAICDIYQQLQYILGYAEKIREYNNILM